MKATTWSAVAVVILAAAAVAAPPDDSHRMAGDITKAALKFAKKRAAVVSFSGVTGRDSLSGAVISARLAQKLLASGSMDVVERDILDKAFEERTGSPKKVTAGVAVALGREMGIDAVIAGTVLELKDGRIEVNARMIDTGTGKVIAATSGRIEKDWSNFADDPAPWDLPVPPIPSLDDGQVVNVSWSPPAGREVEVSDCGSARGQLNRYERDLIDVKARFWALKLKERDFSISSLKRNPGSEIADLRLKEVFYSRLRYWHQEDYVPGLTREEFDGLKKYQKLLELVANHCGL
ncbi:MAG: hypothetical protein HY748_15260 [Elusimicrobia bacterium]|nr:hypothetical protein [Elusimicrobiota bacterium]